MRERAEAARRPAVDGFRRARFLLRPHERKEQPGRFLEARRCGFLDLVAGLFEPARSLSQGGGDRRIDIDHVDFCEHCHAPHLARGRLDLGHRCPPRITRIARRHRDQSEPKIADRARQRALNMGELRGDRGLLRCVDRRSERGPASVAARRRHRHRPDNGWSPHGRCRARAGQSRSQRLRPRRRSSRPACGRRPRD